MPPSAARESGGVEGSCFLYMYAAAFILHVCCIRETRTHSKYSTIEPNTTIAVCVLRFLVPQLSELEIALEAVHLGLVGLGIGPGAVEIGVLVVTL